MTKIDYIFKHGNLTDFEKRLFRERENRELKVEIGKLKSEVDELKYLLEQDIDKKKLVNYKQQVKDMQVGFSRLKRAYNVLMEDYLKLKEALG